MGVDADHPVDGVASRLIAMAPLCRWPGRVGLEDTARRFCDGSQPHGAGQAAHQASRRRARSTPAPRQTARHQGNPHGRLNRCESCRGARRRILTRSPRPLRTTHRTVALAAGGGVTIRPAHAPARQHSAPGGTVGSSAQRIARGSVRSPGTRAGR
jgi:hypothetical protein